ncbi:unnamed protein product [Trifolium pratense]|uniref:Uncharacterized protein n=1 Tax=Trifolium pratense TaxID=57577 RepID=A0ACB0LIH2_TRIPR|nr:unnamed protein product [Trifolium pratense]
MMMINGQLRCIRRIMDIPPRRPEPIVGDEFGLLPSLAGVECHDQNHRNLNGKYILGAPHIVDGAADFFFSYSEESWLPPAPNQGALQHNPFVHRFGKTHDDDQEHDDKGEE